MEAVIHQSLSNILLGDACLLLQGSHIDDELVAATIALGQVHDIVMFPNPVHDVVGIQNSISCALSDTLFA